ncbi:MAG: helix-turn-helix transcriptional regulator [Halobacteriovoraceae bacterium]|jgi:DNA-binding transcriptional regulator YiaG|nr:helix-turn-helix transcriptional regulator [Halobacteriovoraceae bacterium]
MNLENFQGLEYVTVLDIPTKKIGSHEVLAIDHGDIEKAVAKEILKLGIRFRGKEVRFLRKVLGLSLEKFAAKIHLTSGAIQRWEKKENESISPVNEIVLRAFFCDQFQIPMPLHFSEFVGIEEYKNIELKIDTAA